jgi:hypothetical protein
MNTHYLAQLTMPSAAGMGADRTVYEHQRTSSAARSVIYSESMMIIAVGPA